MVKAGLARRQGGRYFLTSYGKLIAASLDIMDKASASFEKLIAIDSMESPNIANNMPKEERRKIVEILISNRQIKEILLLQGGNLQSSMYDLKPYHNVSNGLFLHRSLSVTGPAKQDTELKEVQLLHYSSILGNPAVMDEGMVLH